MSKQLMIAIGREFGSGGHEIARILSHHYNLPLYEENMLDEIAQKRGLDQGKLAKYDETPRNPLLHRTVKGHSNAPGAVIAQMQFEYLNELASAEKSFVVVGRCGGEVLKGRAQLVSLYVCADKECKIKRTMQRGPTSREDAIALIEEKDRNRRIYFNQHTKAQWGNAKNYDLTINSSRLGIEGTAQLIVQYIDTRFA